MKQKPYLKKTILIFSVALALILIGFFSYIYGCPIKNITGYPCISCGMTRAIESFFKGDLVSAFYFHPLFPLAIATLILAVIYGINSKKIGKKLERAIAVFMAITLIIFIITYIIRLNLGIIP